MSRRLVARCIRAGLERKPAYTVSPHAEGWPPLHYRLSVCLMFIVCPVCRFEREQAQVQEQLFRLAQREREAAAATAGRKGEAHDGLNPAVLREKGKTHEELMKTKQLVSQWAPLCCPLGPNPKWKSMHLSRSKRI